MKNRSGRFFSERSAFILIILVIIASVLIIASYEYSIQTSTRISNLSLDETHSNSQIVANDLGHVLENSLESVSANLDVMATSPALEYQNDSVVTELFSAAQNSTKSLTYSYFWLDSNGLLLLSYNGTSQTYSPGTGKNLSQRNFYIFPRSNGTTFFSSATPSLANASVEYVFISRPVYSFTSPNQSKQFDGVVGAAIDLRTLGKSLESVLSPNFHSGVSLLDFKGNILYSTAQSLIGQNVFGETYQSLLPTDLKPEFNAFLNQSLKGNSGFEDLSYHGSSGTLAYQPIFVNATASDGHEIPVQFGVLYVTVADTLAGSAVNLINQQRLASLVIVIGIAGTFGGIAFATLRWNRRLDVAVKEKTSDLLTANEELASKASAEKDLMNITAHELRTPTQSILANTEILRRVIRPALGLPQQNSSQSASLYSDYDSMLSDIQPTEMVDMVESSYRNAQRLQKLTESILEVARIDNRTFRIDKETFELNEIVRQSVEDSRNLLDRRESIERPNIKVSFEPKVDKLYVNADRTKIGEVMSNLLDNAIKFSQEGGTITIFTEKSEDGLYAVVKVRDEGPGIDPDIYPKLFTKFASKSGTGLGLYISRAYVEALGGTMMAENVTGGSEKAGAVFSFTLPIVKVEETAQETQVVATRRN